MSARLFAYLSYADAPAALRWLEAVGFEVVARQDSDDGGVQHSEVRLGDDVDDVFSRAVSTGATPVFAPEDTEWGTRRARLLDPGGLEWSVGTYEPGRGW